MGRLRICSSCFSLFSVFFPSRVVVVFLCLFVCLFVGLSVSCLFVFLSICFVVGCFVICWGASGGGGGVA